MPRIKPVKSSTNKSGSSNFTDRESLKKSFFALTSSRQANKISGDGTYWTGGRCRWGGSHNLDEDIDELANFFNSLAKVDDEINEIKLSANETIFNQKKQALISKIQDLIRKCQVSSSYSVASICCIWNDFFGKFLKKYLDGFSSKLKSQLSSIEKLEPKHQQEILKLEDNLRKAESKYNENLTKYNDPNTSLEEKTKLMILVNEAADEIKKIKGKLKYNPLANLERYNYLDDLERLAKGNVPEPNKPSNSNRRNSSQTPQGENSNSNIFQSSNQTQLFIFVGLVILTLFFLMNQKEHE